MIDSGTIALLAPGKLRWLRAVGWMIALAAVLVIAFNAIVRACLWLLAGDASNASDPEKLVAACAGAVAILVVYWIAIRVVERRRVSELSVRQLPAELLLGSAIGAALIGLIVGILWLFGWVVIEPKPVSRVALALRDSIRSGVVEELLLRLVIFRLLWRGFGIWPALMISAAMFGLLHLANPESSLFAALALAAGEESASDCI